ncbi:MAG: cache domain-containing protein [Proteobacteria bacterium]|nr:cache domain-containing protein [Pseudomonadota bacterium]
MIFSGKTSLSKEYTIFTAITIIVILSIAVVTIYMINKSYIGNNNRILVESADHIDDMIKDSFSYTNRITSHIGKRIASHGSEDLDFIYELFLQESQDYKGEGLFSWSSFDWVDKNGLQRVNSKVGVRDNPPNMIDRKYTRLAPQFPWTLQISSPTIGNPSGSWVIPAGTGVVDNKGRYLGIVVVGFSVDRLSEKILNSIQTSDNVSFIVLDDSLNIILQSPNNNLIPDNNFYKNYLKHINPFSQQSGMLKDAIKVDDIFYSYYHKMDEYPYIILTGFNQKFISKEFSSIVLPRALELLVLTLFFMTILYFFRSQAFRSCITIFQR